MKTKIMGIVTVVLVLGTVQVARANLVDSNSIVQNGIEYYMQTDKAVYNLGENVEMLFKVTNLRDEDVTIPCSRSWEFNLLVEENGEAIWALAHWFVWYSPGVKLLAGESREIPYTWDMKGDTGYLIVPGTYGVIGVMYNYEQTEVGVQINVLPEPNSLSLFIASMVFLKHLNGRRGRFDTYKS